MKPHRWAIVILLSSFALAQSAPPQAPKATPKATQPGQQQNKGAGAAGSAATKPVPENAPVITLAGICENAATKPAECKTIVTRAQFEKIIGALTGGRQNPDEVPPQVRRQIAT